MWRTKVRPRSRLAVRVSLESDRKEEEMEGGALRREPESRMHLSGVKLLLDCEGSTIHIYSKTETWKAGPHWPQRLSLSPSLRGGRQLDGGAHGLKLGPPPRAPLLLTGAAGRCRPCRNSAGVPPVAPPPSSFDQLPERALLDSTANQDYGLTNQQ